MTTLMLMLICHHFNVVYPASVYLLYTTVNLSSMVGQWVKQLDGRVHVQVPQQLQLLRQLVADVFKLSVGHRDVHTFPRAH